MAKQTYTTGQVLTAAQMTTLQTNDFNQTVSAKTASYTLVAADAGTRITMSNASATTVTVNTNLFTAGDTLQITNIGAGICTITAGTATVSTAGVLTLAQNASGTLYFTSTGVSIFDGSAAAASGVTFAGAQAKSDSVSFAYTSNVSTLMTFSTENFDTNSFHSTSSNTGRLTIPAGGDGKYLFAVDGISMGTVPGYVFIRLVKNGTVFGGGNQIGAMFAVTTGNNNAQCSGSIIASAVAGDYFEAFIQSDQGTGTVTLNGLWSCAFLGA